MRELSRLANALHWDINTDVIIAYNWNERYRLDPLNWWIQTDLCGDAKDETEIGKMVKGRGVYQDYGWDGQKAWLEWPSPSTK
jgi:hypothetical protein